MNFSVSMSRKTNVDFICLAIYFSHSHDCLYNPILSVCCVMHTTVKQFKEVGLKRRCLVKDAKSHPKNALLTINVACISVCHGSTVQFVCTSGARNKIHWNSNQSLEERLYYHTNKVLGLGCLDLPDGVTLTTNTLLIRSVLNGSQTQCTYWEGTLQCPWLCQPV